MISNYDKVILKQKKQGENFNVGKVYTKSTLLNTQCCCSISNFHVSKVSPDFKNNRNLGVALALEKSICFNFFQKLGAVGENQADEVGMLAFSHLF